MFNENTVKQYIKNRIMLTNAENANLLDHNKPMDEHCSNIQNSLEPSITKIGSTICHHEFCGKSFEMQNSTNYKNIEVINVSSDSDESNNYYNDTYDSDISVDSIRRGNDYDPNSRLDSFYKIYNQLPINLSKKPQDKIQNDLMRVIEENNRNKFTKFAPPRSKSNSPQPGCSKDLDDTSRYTSMVENPYYPNCDKLVEEAKLISKLLPNYNSYLIYKTLCKNLFAKNHIELTLWDLLPRERPQADCSRKRKSLDKDIRMKECKMIMNYFLQMKRIDIKREKINKRYIESESCFRPKLNTAFRPSINEIYDMDSDDTSDSDTENEPNQPKLKPIKKVKLNDTLDEPTNMENDDNIYNKDPVDSKSASSNVKSYPESLPGTSTQDALPSTGILQPAKLTLKPNLSRQNTKQAKLLASILSPPKFHFIKKSSIDAPTRQTGDRPFYSTCRPSVSSANYLNESVLLPGISNDKRASTPPLQLCNSFLPGAFIVPSTDKENMEMEDATLADTNPLTESFYNEPLNLVERECKEEIDQQSVYDEILNLTGFNLIKAKNDEKEAKVNTNKETVKHAEEDSDKKITLNKTANEIYIKLIPMFPSVKTDFIKRLCHDYIKNLQQPLDKSVILEHLIDTLLNCDQEDPKDIEPLPVTKNDKQKSELYDINERYADLLILFPEADPMYLRKMAEEIHDNEKYNEFVQSKLEKQDYPTRTEYLAKKKLTEQQKQYTTDFQVEKFLEIFPDPFSYFENEKRVCQFNTCAIDFLKYYFNKLRVSTLIKTYGQYQKNLSLTAKALETLKPDMKNKRYYNNIILSEDIPFLQECAFIQHKASIRKYLDEIKAKEEQEFNELKAKNGLFECQCCYDNECMPSKCSTCEDGHIFCNLCIIHSVDVILGDGKTRVDCLLNCGCEFSISVLQRVLPPTKFSILLCKRQEAEVMAAGVEGLVSCPFCHFASIPPPEDKIFKCFNPECMKESCRLCKELNHVPLKCYEKKSESARLYLEEKMTEALVRKCYRCNRMFFKEEGCNKMTCICGAQMCYICDKPVTDYKHFKGQGTGNSNLCPLWSDDRRLNAESVIKVCEETMKQIKEKDPEVDINVEALLPKLPPRSNGPHEQIAQNVIDIHYRIMRHLQ